VNGAINPEDRTKIGGIFATIIVVKAQQSSMLEGLRIGFKNQKMLQKLDFGSSHLSATSNRIGRWFLNPVLITVISQFAQMLIEHGAVEPGKFRGFCLVAIGTGQQSSKVLLLESFFRFAKR